MLRAQEVRDGLPQALIDRMYDDLDHGTRRAVLKLYRATGDLAVTARRMAEALRQIPRPELVVWGKHDPYVPVAFAERQREVFPGAQVVIMEGSGHWPFADDPDGVARVAAHGAALHRGRGLQTEYMLALLGSDEAVAPVGGRTT
jgi:pimeloyl-ACP methyl ester carboxylesterase